MTLDDFHDLIRNPKYVLSGQMFNCLLTINFFPPYYALGLFILDKLILKYPHRLQIANINCHVVPATIF
jgi:hypothetical protein